MTRSRRECRASPWTAALGLALAIAPASAPAQGVNGGSPGGGSGVAGSAPRGSAARIEESEGSSAELGGLAGGRGRKSGTPGASTRSDLRESPGDPAESRLGPPIGASGAAGAQGSNDAFPLIVPGARFGPNVRPTPPGGGGHDRFERDFERLRRDRRRLESPDSDPLTLARRPLLALPPEGEDPGPEGGLTLDAALGLLMARNLDLMARRFEVPKAEADVLTASLRNNPILNADAQLVPYGHYSNLRPGGGGGQPQYDVNISYPLDLSRKRRARIDVARRAKGVTEAQLQDSARLLIDDLYAAFVNVLAARETLRFSGAYLAVVAEQLGQAEREAESAERDEDRKTWGEAVDALRDRANQARFQSRRAGQTLARARRELARLLDLPPDQAEALEVRGLLREPSPPPPPAQELVLLALSARPDLASYRLGLGRARADVTLARAERFSDVYLVYQPYTFQDNTAFGLKGTYSYAVGVNAALPIYNRNQGNIARAEWNLRQTDVERLAIERRVIHEVEEAARDLELSASGVAELEREVLPASRRARDDAFSQFREDPSKVNDYLDKQQDFNEVVQAYRDALIEHRQAMLGLNTAVGERVMP